MQENPEILSFLNPEIAAAILKESETVEIPKGKEILREGQYVKTLPIVISGLVKVDSRFQDKELLLYYIEPEQSCIMTFYAALKNTQSKVVATTEEDSKILLLPVRFLPDWLNKYPDFNQLFYNQFNTRYLDLLETISQLLLDKMDKRVYDHLKKKLGLMNKSTVKMSHHQIANELGTAREVVSRMLKKLEIEGKVKQQSGTIRIIDEW